MPQYLGNRGCALKKMMIWAACSPSLSAQSTNKILSKVCCDVFTRKIKYTCKNQHNILLWITIWIISDNRKQYDCDQTVTKELYFSFSLPGKTHQGNPCYGLQGLPPELTPRVIPCCIVRILEECKNSIVSKRYTQPALQAPCIVLQWVYNATTPHCTRTALWAG